MADSGVLDVAANPKLAHPYVVRMPRDEREWTKFIQALLGDFNSIVGGLQDFADDTAAEAGGVPINGLYRNGSVVMIRVV